MNLFAKYNVQWQVAREGLRPSCCPPLTYKYHETFAKKSAKLCTVKKK